MPLSFWFFSVAGGGMLLLYSMFQRDTVFIVGQAASLVIYPRSLYLIFRERSHLKAIKENR